MAAMSHKDWLSRRQRQKQGMNGPIYWGNIEANRLIRNDIESSVLPGGQETEHP